METLIQKLSKHDYKPEASAKDKRAEYTHLLASFLLREKIEIVLEIIDSTKENPFDEVNFSLERSNLTNLMLNKAIECDQEEYSTNGEDPKINKIFFSLVRYIKKERKHINKQAIFERTHINTEKALEAIKENYKEIAEKIEKIFTKANPLGISALSKIRHKVNRLIRYNKSVINEVLRALNSRIYIPISKNDKNSVFGLRVTKKTTLEMTDKKLDQCTIVDWFGIKEFDEAKKGAATNASSFVSERVANNGFYYVNLSEWNSHMQVSLDKNDKERKDTLLKLGQALENINLMFLVLYEVLAEKSTAKVDPILVEKIQGTAEFSRVLCYAEKLSKLNSMLDDEPVLYTLCTINLALEIEENKCTEYSVLNPNSYSTIQNTRPLLFVLQEEKTQKVLNYLQSLVEQYKKTNNTIALLLDNEQLQKQNDLSERLCKEIIEKNLKPYKALPPTSETNNEIRNVLDRIEGEVEEITQINSKPTFYSMQKNLIMFDSAIKILEQFISKDAEEAIRAYTEYKTANIVQKIKNIIEKEKEKEISQSKHAVMNCEKIIIDVGKQVPYLLLQAADVYIDLLSDFSVQQDNSDCVSQSIHDLLLPEEKEEKSDSVKTYLITGIALLLVVVIAFIALCFFAKKKKERK